MDGASDIRDKSLYDRDTLAWTEEQSRLLRTRDWTALDLENIIEEIESLGRSQRSSLNSALTRIMEHMIKLDYGLNREPERGWIVSIANHRNDADEILEENPSLRRDVAAALPRQYRRARKLAMVSFGQYEPDRLAEYEKTIPLDCPFAENDVLGNT